MRRLRLLLTPPALLAEGMLAMVGGAALIALWVVGLVVMVDGALLALVALLRDTTIEDDSDLSTTQAILRRYARSR